MKVYLVVEGDSECYEVLESFVSKEKAHKYKELFRDCREFPSDSLWVKEIETKDEVMDLDNAEIKNYISVVYEYSDNNLFENFSINLLKTNTIKYNDLTKDPYTHKSYKYNFIRKTHTIKINVLVGDNFTDKDITQSIKETLMNRCKEYLSQSKKEREYGTSEHDIEAEIFKNGFVI